ncbi:hypothetical protein ACFV5N_02285 [Streptomyces sp. NPDC059853]|uniref:hypothetical protein n=1 Tax=Streptomyces sp. NPDC059853 TaxID=3346973 RepID=UPI00365F9F7B
MTSQTYARLRAEIVAAQLAWWPLPYRLRRGLRAVSADLSPLRVGTLMDPVIHRRSDRYGRAVAAQLAELAIAGHIWFSFGGGYLGEKGLEVSRHPGVPPVREEELRLMRIVLGDEERARIAGRIHRRAWRELARLLRQELDADRLGPFARDRALTLGILRDLGLWMAEYARGRPPWEENPALHLAGYPYAVLFGLDTGPARWPEPPDEHVFLPSLLPQACTIALKKSRRSLR